MTPLDDLVRRRYQRETALAALRRAAAPNVFIANAERLVELCRKRLRRVGVDDTRYVDLLKVCWPKLLQEQRNEDFMETCLVRLRYLQKNSREKQTCWQGHDCGPVCCREYAKATDEQVRRYLNDLSIDTGEPLEEERGH
jgi:hypothetical protein